jgi:hypothetical protein
MLLHVTDPILAIFRTDLVFSKVMNTVEGAAVRLAEKRFDRVGILGVGVCLWN